MRTSILLLTILLMVGCSSTNTDPVGSNTSDGLLPHVSISRLGDGNVLGSNIYGIDVTAYHSSGIEFVQLKIGLKDMRLDYEAPYSFVWVVAPDANPEVQEGAYEICALAVDKNGNSNRHCITVEVKY